jgi:long-chain acyl-CoA synthetase
VLELLRTHLLAKYPSLAGELVAAQGERVWKHWWRFRQVHRAFGWKFWAIVCGGASLPEALESFWNTLGFALIQGYGLTETAALVTLNHPFKIGRGTIGKPLPGREVRLGENGEILVRGEMLSRATWQGGRLQVREQEWLETGDLATQDENGDLRFAGRTSDVIVTAAGMNIHAADLEAALAAQPGVKACAVVGCAVAGGDEPVAVLIFSGSDQELAEAVRAANAGLAEYQKIRRWLRWPELSLPYTTTGKLIRRRIAAWACGALAGEEGRPLVSATGDALLDLIAKVTGETCVAAAGGSLLTEDLRLDSLGRVQLQSLLEQRLGMELADDALAEMRTLGELRALIDPREQDGAAPAVAAGFSGAETDLARAPGSVDGHFYPHWPWWTPVELLRAVFIEGIMRPLVWLLAAPRVVREPNELPDGPLLLIANHVSSYDGALVLYALPGKLRRRVAIAMSGEMLLEFRKARRRQIFPLRVLGPLAYLSMTALFNVFPLPRSGGFRRSFAHAGEAMDRGYSVMIFPEGHRSEDGALQTFRSGIGLLAAQSRVPILPVALTGLGEMKLRGTGWFRSGRLGIRVGKPLIFDGGPDAGAMTRELERRVRELLEGG